MKTCPIAQPSLTRAGAPLRRALAATLALSMLLVACGGGDASDEAQGTTAGKGPRATRLAAGDMLEVQLPQFTDPLLTGLTIPADAPTRGMWSATASWPLIGLHAA